MKHAMRKGGIFRKAAVIAILFVMIIGCIPFMAPQKAEAADSFDALLTKWTDHLTGGSDINGADPTIAAIMEDLDHTSQLYWDQMEKSVDREYIFPDLNTQFPTQNITESYTRIRTMAISYATTESTLYHNQQLLDDMISALDWLNDNWYNAATPYGTQSLNNNWFVWEIGAPWPLEDTMALLYDELSSEQLANYSSAIKHYVVTPTSTGTSMGQRWGNSGANLAWKSLVWSQLGILDKDGSIISEGKDAIGGLFVYSTAGDGFYEDGSFIQHGAFPYTAGYGLSNLSSSVDLIYLLGNTQWALDSAKSSVIRDWIYQSYMTVIYNNRIYDNLSGRYLSRYAGADGISSLIEPAYKVADMLAGTPDEIRIKSFIKLMIDSDSAFDFTKRNLFFNTKIKDLMNDASIPVMEPQSIFKSFPNMDRFSWMRPNAAFSVGMSSSRINNYESINYENLQGWHVGDGRESLYTGDPDSFGDYYWETVDPYRLPGTTVEAMKAEDVDSPTIGSISLTTDGSGYVDDMTSSNSRYDYSHNWQFTAGPLDDDASLAKRKTDTLEFLVYNKPNITSFEAIVYSLNDHPLTAEGLLLSYSPDNQNWKSIGTTILDTAPITGTDWSKSTVRTSSPIPSGTNYFKIEVPSTESPQGSTTGEDWAGSTDMDGLYGVSGMQLHPSQENLMAKKSWFMFDNEIVALGSDIHGGDGSTVETTVLNSKLGEAGDNALTVDGAVESNNIGWNRELANVDWLHLAGHTADSGVGYYFPSGANLHALREARTGSNADLSHGGNEDETEHTRNYLTLWYDHGKDPGTGANPAASYAYTLLLAFTAEESAAYAASPDVSVVENDADAQAVRENTLNMLGVNFWQDQIKQVDEVKVNRKASLILKENEDQTLDISLSDPTQSNNGVIDVEIMKSANPDSGWISDPEITVYQTSPTIRFQVHVEGSKGKTFKAKFNLGSDIWPQQPPTAPPPKPSTVIIDDLNDYSHVFEVSNQTNLLFDNGNPSVFDGDASRLKRYKQEVPESLTYKADHVINFSAKLFYRNGYADKLKAYASPDNQHWTQVPLKVDTPVATQNTWFMANFSPAEALPNGTQYIKLEIGNDPLIYSPELGSVTLYTAPISTVEQDSLNDWSKAYKHSLFFDFDSANAKTQYDNDYSRLRASEDDQSITYKIEHVLGFQGTLYSNAAQLDGLISAEVSADDAGWTPIPLKWEDGVPTADGMIRYAFSQDEAIPEDANYIRFHIAKSDAATQIELGSLALEKGSFTDSLDGFDYTSFHSENLSFEKGSTKFDGDLSLAKRVGTEDAPGELIYYYPDVNDFAVKMYALSGFAGKLNISASKDGISWDAVSLKSDAAVTNSSNWQYTTFNAAEQLDPGYRYLKLNIGNDTRIYSPMISQVTLHRTLSINGPLPEPIDGPQLINDGLNDWSKTDTHSAGLSFDGSNAPYFNGDTSRVKRNSDTEQSMTYHYSNIVNFEPTVYPCVEPPEHALNLEDQFSLYSSSDGQSWSQVLYEANVPETTSCWKMTTLKPKANFPDGTNYLKIIMKHDSRIWAPQISQVLIDSDGAAAKQITALNLGDDQIGETAIDKLHRTVTVHVKAGTDLAALQPVIETSPDTAIAPLSGQEQDFSEEGSYKVTAADKTYVNWKVQVLVDEDTEPPVTRLDVEGQQGAADWYSSSVILKLQATDEASGVDYTEYRLDGSEWTRYSHEISVSDDGEHTWQYRSVDLSGNVEETQPFNFKLDQQAPSISFAAIQESYDLGDKLIVTQLTYDDISGVASTDISLNGESIAANAEVVLTQPGTNLLKITSIDNAGNSNTQTMAFEVYMKAEAEAAPRVLKINSGTFTIRLSLPEGYSASDVIPNLVTINGSVQPVSLKTIDNDGHQMLQLKVERSDLADLDDGIQQIVIAGQFQGDAAIRFRAYATVEIK